MTNYCYLCFMIIKKPKQYYLSLSPAEQWFKSEILDHLIGPLKSDQHPNTLFFKLNNEIVMEVVYTDEQDQKNGVLWVKYNKIWLVFESRFSMEYEQTQALIKDMVERYYNLGELTPKLLKITSATRKSYTGG